MKNRALVSSKDKSKKLKCCLLQFLFGALRVNMYHKNKLIDNIPTTARGSSKLMFSPVYHF